jgi:hypothetical protein
MEEPKRLSQVTNAMPAIAAQAIQRRPERTRKTTIGGGRQVIAPITLWV